MKKIVLILLLSFLAPTTAFGQLKSYSVEEAEAECKKNPKPYVIFTYTSWCKFCHIMKNTTFKSAEVIAMLNDSFYFVMLDAENKSDITFRGHSYKFKKTGNNIGTHELATALSDSEKEKTYPLLTIMDADYSIVYQKHSFIDSPTLLSILGQMIRKD